jgi:hypothetical protein
MLFTERKVMSEILRSEDIQAGYEEGVFDSRSEKETGKILHLKQEELSSVDYNSQIISSMFFDMFGIRHFDAGNYKKGIARLVGSVVLSFFNLAPLNIFFAMVSVFQLNEGKCKDSDGKVIRQVVRLKKEEISSTDQKTALILSLCLGFFGAHQFYTGKPLKGVLMLCTLGGMGVWWSLNIYQIATCGFRDSEDKVLCPSYIKESHGM